MFKYLIFISFCIVAQVNTTSDINFENWMGDNMDYLKDKLLSEVTIPGSHNSGTYWLSSDMDDSAQSPNVIELIKFAKKMYLPINKVITPWAQCTSMTIFQQLMAGVRSFDLRFYWKDNNYVIVHTELGVSADIIFADFKKFLVNHPKEVILIFLRYDETHKDSMVDILMKSLKPYIFPNGYNGLTDTIGNMVDKNQRVVIVTPYQTRNSSGLFFVESEVIYQQCGYCNCPNPSELVKSCTDKVNNFKVDHPSNQLFYVSWILTPDTDTILQMFNIFGSMHDLKDLTAIAHNQLTVFYFQNFMKGNRLGNILAVDFFDYKIMTIIMGLMKLPK